MTLAMLRRADDLATFTVARIPLRRMFLLVLRFLHGELPFCLRGLRAGDCLFCFMGSFVEEPLELR